MEEWTVSARADARSGLLRGFNREVFCQEADRRWCEAHEASGSCVRLDDLIVANQILEGTLP